jgi:glycosyltransferase involved in cell wall biosynthesis
LADVVVYPTVGEEPYGLVPVEAMSCARPVVASKSGGITETIIDGVTGFIVPRGDVGCLVERVAQLFTDPILARRFGSSGRLHVEEYFNAQTYVETLVDRYATKMS